ncbi:MAG: ATP-binding cassette domain-containing protein [Lachnospiraceae bacterium]|nr:ATP-binding cassette domain-containing protein [Lachnospiraceae bacterium]
MDYVMELDGLSKSYGGKRVVDSFSLKMEKGHIYGLIGPNGAGKTTVMKMMAGLTGADAGSIRFFGSEDLDKMRDRISFIIEEPYMDLNMTARQNMEYLRLLRGIPDKGRIDELLSFVGLENTGKKPAKQFSLGMRQRLGLAMSILPGPEIMVLDEPINGLDPEGIIDIRNMLKELCSSRNMTILISSHILKELSELCTDYAIIREGKLVEELSHEELLQKTHTRLALQTDDVARTATILEDKLNLHDYKITHENEILIYERLDDLRTISKTVTDHGLIITRFNLEGESLEEYYIGKVGENHE